MKRTGKTRYFGGNVKQSRVAELELQRTAASCSTVLSTIVHNQAMLLEDKFKRRIARILNELQELQEEIN